jgi:hypothetical protein
LLSANKIIEFPFYEFDVKFLVVKVEGAIIKYKIVYIIAPLLSDGSEALAELSAIGTNIGINAAQRIVSSNNTFSSSKCF